MRNITGLILAGGRGQRVGGADKGWLIYEGRPLIVSVIERFAPQVGPLLISANRNVERYAAYGEIVGDDLADVMGERFAGPLIGVLSGLRRAVIDRVLPQVDCGRFAIKRCVGDTLEVMADAFVDGHEVPRVRLMHRRRAAPAWRCRGDARCGRARGQGRPSPPPLRRRS